MIIKPRSRYFVIVLFLFTFIDRILSRINYRGGKKKTHVQARIQRVYIDASINPMTKMFMLMSRDAKSLLRLDWRKMRVVI
jgi:hypothetical protein